MPAAPDPDLGAILQSFGIDAGAALGAGGEAAVFALGDDRVLRILHDGGQMDDVSERRRLVDELRRGPVPFSLPHVLEAGRSGDRVYTVERRLPGRPLLEVLPAATGAARRRLVEHALEAAAELGDLVLARPEGFGDLVGDDRLVSATWRDFLIRRAAANLARSTADLRGVDPGPLAAAFAEPDRACFVHLDAYAGNMLVDGTGAVTAVLDIGRTSVAGDRRFDPLSVAVYLCAPEITPGVTAADADVAQGWLRHAGLDDLYAPAARWLAAYWSFAVDDPPLSRWCHRVLLGR